jgi:porin
MKYILLSLFLVASVMGAEALTRDESRVQHRHSPQDKSIWDCDCLSGYLTDDWVGARKKLSEKGVEFTFVYTGEVFSNISGGLRRGTTYEGLLDLGMDIDFEKLAEFKGGLFHANAYWIHGSSPSAKYVGDLQTLSNIDAFDTLRLNELWYEQSLWNNRFSIRLGQLGADKEFNFSEYAALFLNAGFGWPPFIGNNVSAPAYPMGAPGVRLRWDPYDACYFQMGVYDGEPTPQRLNESGTHFNLHDADGRFAIYEFGYKYNQEEKSKGLPGTYKIGVWQHTDSFPDRVRGTDGLSLADPASNGEAALHQGNYGIYGIVDQMVYREKGDRPESDEGLGVFFRGGNALDDRNLVSLQLMGGTHYKGLIPGRDEDIVGLGVTHVEIGDHVRKFDSDTNGFSGTTSPVRDFETAIEFTYRVAIAPWWAVQPDFQWIIHPGGSSATGDAVVVGVRSSIIF